jgi:RNA polymerase sigma-70 factor (ECF subfamily)
MAEPVPETSRWLAEARAGSVEALGHALNGCRRYLLLVASQHIDVDLQAKGGASDLVQATFLEAQLDFARFQGTSEQELIAWLRRILVNNAGNFARHFRATEKRAVSREISLPPDGSTTDALVAPLPSPSGVMMAHEQITVLHRALGRLPDDYRRVIILRYLDGCSFDEVGRLMNRSPEATRKLWSRAMERLRVEWETPS